VLLSAGVDRRRRRPVVVEPSVRRDFPLEQRRDGDDGGAGLHAALPDRRKEVDRRHSLGGDERADLAQEALAVVRRAARRG
jgi:hypothetical protein